MEFVKALSLCQPAKTFIEERLTTAQVEQIITAGLAAPVRLELEESFHISAIRSERVLDHFEGEISDFSLQTQEEIKSGGPVYFVISVKDHQHSKESLYLYAGMIMANMQLQATNDFLGYNFTSEQPNLKMLHAPYAKKRLGIPEDFSPIQILKVGYTSEEVERRKPHMSEVFTRIIS